VVSESKAWFGASRGVWGYTEDAGITWHIDSIKVDTISPQFRSIAVLNDSTVLLLSIASPAYLFKTTNKGKTWRLVYENTNKDIFFDCMKFYTKTSGIALGDPVDGCIQMIRTENAGETWSTVDCATLPKPEQGEACFAASNSNLDVYAENMWFATGGLQSRFFHSSDFGKHFTVYDHPLPKGEKMSGIYSLDFFDEKVGAIAGSKGDDADSSVTRLALTKNGGRTWTPILCHLPYTVGCVQFRSTDEFFITSRNGTFRYSLKEEKLTEIKDLHGASLKYWTLRISPSGNAIWLAGQNGMIGLVKLGGAGNK
jgi:photosystem II stability/assembly factor-like uncharacterized protein